MTFPIVSGNIPYLTTDQMIEVDRTMMVDYGIVLIQMMENAGRNLAHLARVRFLDGNPADRHVVVLAGTGGNGGGALVCARRLHSWGARVDVFLTAHVKELTPVTGHQLNILRRMGVSIHPTDQLAKQGTSELIIDGLIGYSLRGAPYGTAGDMIRWANGQTANTLSLDVPSGVDTTTGTVFDPAIEASATLTLALPKEGLRASGVAPHVGELFLGDVSVPPALYAIPGLDLTVDSIFAESDVIQLW